jgi:hypothetical protein
MTLTMLRLHGGTAIWSIFKPTYRPQMHWFVCALGNALDSYCYLFFVMWQRMYQCLVFTKHFFFINALYLCILQQGIFHHSWMNFNKKIIMNILECLLQFYYDANNTQSLEQSANFSTSNFVVSFQVFKYFYYCKGNSNTGKAFATFRIENFYFISKSPWVKRSSRSPASLLK